MDALFCKDWTIDCNDYGSHFWDIYHVVSSTPKTMLLLSGTLFAGDVNKDGQALMDKVVDAYQTGASLLNQPTTPRRYKLFKGSRGEDYFKEGQGTALKHIRLNGPLLPVTFLPPAAVTTPPGR